MMPKGEYYVGDLCYVLDDVWDEVCNNLSEGEHTLSDGRRYAIYYTAWGDGVYLSNIGTTHPVDSGTIGVIGIDDIGGFYANQGASVNFEVDFSTSSDNGVIEFGHVIINTRSDDEESYNDDANYSMEDNW